MNTYFILFIFLLSLIVSQNSFANATVFEARLHLLSVCEASVIVTRVTWHMLSLLFSKEGNVHHS